MLQNISLHYIIVELMLIKVEKLEVMGLDY